jgi:hypothetical protein
MNIEEIRASLWGDFSPQAKPDKYFEWRSTVPKSHKNRIGETTSHLCIFNVWLEGYKTLRAVELSLTPPLVLLPPAPPAKSAKTTLSIAEVVSYGGSSQGTRDEYSDE